MWPQGEKFKNYVAMPLSPLMLSSLSLLLPVPLSLSPSQPRTSPSKLNTRETGKFSILGNILGKTKSSLLLHNELKSTTLHEGFECSKLAQWPSNVEAVVLKLAAQKNDLQSLKQQCLGPGLIYSVWAGTVLRKVRPVMPTCVGVDPLFYR